MRALPWLLAIAALGGCAMAPVPFPARAPLTVDGDTRPVSVPCRPDPSPKDPRRVTCAPAVYVSPFLWDKVDKTVFARVQRFLAVDTGGEAVNVNSVDEVPDSAWFTHRSAQAPDALARGACTPQDLLPTDVPNGGWVIDHGKDDGATPGFRVNVPGHGEYLLKADEPGEPERASAASAIGAALYHAVGFNTTCEQVVYLRRSQLRLTPGLTVTSNLGERRAFDERALDAILAASPHRGDWIRMEASQWLPNPVLGPFRYQGTRADDPNDVVRHQDRRELRGSRLLAAWLNHWDAREQNTLDTWIASDAAHPRSSPGYVRHYILDTSDVLGQQSRPPSLARRLGHSYLLDVRDIAIDFFTFGALQRAWDRARVDPAHPRFGYFSARDFDPAAWKESYPNPAFLRMTERDAAWMARRIARFGPDDVRAIVAAGKLSDSGDAEYVTAILLERQRRILARYLTRLSPLTDVRQETDGRICAVDLARLRGVLPPGVFRYAGDMLDGTARRPLATMVEPAGRVCFAVPADLAAAPGSPRVFELRNGTRAGPLDVYAYEREGRRLQVVGLRRPR